MGNSVAFGVNELGQIVGWSDVLSVAGQHAFIWESGVMTDLNDLLVSGNDWTLTEARAINDQGQIIGIGFLEGVGGGQAFLLTPIPEPSTGLLFAAGLAGLGMRGPKVLTQGRDWPFCPEEESGAGTFPGCFVLKGQSTS